jgi:hypothetical protein
MKHFGRQRIHCTVNRQQHGVMPGLTRKHPKAVHRLSHRWALPKKDISHGILALPTLGPHLAPLAALLDRRLNHFMQVRWATLIVNQGFDLIRFHSFMNLEYPKVLNSVSTIFDQFVYAQPANICSLP